MLRSKWPLPVLFLSIFAFFSFFGLWQAKWGELDYLQTYLIGLKFYTTGAWPFFGPDVNGAENPAFQSQIPGALEGLSIGLPFHLLPLPEAPFLFLNLFNAGAVLLLAYYLHRRLPSLSFVWLALWIAGLPWLLHEGTNLINPAFLFVPGVLFLVGFMEATPGFGIGWLPRSWSNALVGFGLFFAMQFHFSYIYLVPLAALSLFAQVWQARKPQPLLYFLLGALPPLALAIPTYLKYGLGTNNVAGGFAAAFNWDNARDLGTILARFLSMPSYEMPRFLGLSTTTRLGFLQDHPSLLLPGAVLWVAGLLQPFALLACWFLPDKSQPQWKNLKRLFLALLVMVEVSFWFTTKKPFSHIFFILLPFGVLYASQCGAFFAGKGWARILAKTLVVFSLFFHLLYAPVFEPQYSIYPQREKVVKAIQAKDYRVMGERRPGSYY